MQNLKDFVWSKFHRLFWFNIFTSFLSKFCMPNESMFWPHFKKMNFHSKKFETTQFGKNKQKLIGNQTKVFFTKTTFYLTLFWPQALCIPNDWSLKIFRIRFEFRFTLKTKYFPMLKEKQFPFIFGLCGGGFSGILWITGKENNKKFFQG